VARPVRVEYAGALYHVINGSVHACERVDRRLGDRSDPLHHRLQAVPARVRRRKQLSPKR